MVGIKRKVIWTAVLVAILLTGNWLYHQIQGGFESSMAVGQLNDSIPRYAFSNALASGAIYKLFVLLISILAAIAWYPVIFKKEKVDEKVK